MKNAKLAKTLATVGLAAACAAGLAACGSNDGSGGVAATVNGTEISEADVTAQIENTRAQVISYYMQYDEEMTEDDAWGEYLVAIGETPESLREETIDSLIERELINAGAAEKGVTIEESEIDKYVEEMSSRYESPEEWQEILAEAGFTEESYRDTIRTALIDQGLQDAFDEASEPDEADLLETAQLYAPYYDGAKRSSHILIKVADTTDEAAMAEARERAQEILDRINSGEIDFADAAREYSEDTSAESGGDVGWDALNSFVSEYADALDALELGQVSGLVESSYGIHIIKCTEIFTAPEEVTSMDQMPEAFRSTIESMAKSSATSNAYQAWIDAMKEAATIVINPMPANVPYKIDLTPYQEEEETSADVEADEEIEVEAEDAEEAE